MWEKRIERNRFFFFFHKLWRQRIYSQINTTLIVWHWPSLLFFLLSKKSDRNNVFIPWRIDFLGRSFLYSQYCIELYCEQGSTRIYCKYIVLLRMPCLVATWPGFRVQRCFLNPCVEASQTGGDRWTWEWCLGPRQTKGRPSIGLRPIFLLSELWKEKWEANWEKSCCETKQWL